MLIIVEGRDGVGKTTFAKDLVSALTAAETSVISVREPVDRACLKADAPIKAFAQDRLKQLREVVVPALLSDVVVVSDRSIFSSLAYQNLEGDYAVEGQILQANAEAVRLLRALARKGQLLVVCLNPVIALRLAAENIDENDKDAGLQQRLCDRYREVMQSVPQELFWCTRSLYSSQEYPKALTSSLNRAMAARGSEVPSEVRDWLARAAALG